MYVVLAHVHLGFPNTHHRQTIVVLLVAGDLYPKIDMRVSILVFYSVGLWCAFSMCARVRYRCVLSICAFVCMYIYVCDIYIYIQLCFVYVVINMRCAFRTTHAPVTVHFHARTHEQSNMDVHATLPHPPTH